jgi:GNAT superfamily N-acetyltransferase
MNPLITVRTARLETDLHSIVFITNIYEPFPVTEDQVQSWFQYNPSGRIQHRLVAANEKDEIVGYSGFVHEASAPEGQFTVWVLVDPIYHFQGIGSALWDETLNALIKLGATHLTSDLSDNDPVSLKFAERCGFAINHHMFHAILDLTTFDETPYLPVISSLEAEGIRFCSLADFPDTPETRRKLHGLNSTNELDIPNMDNNQTGFAEFEKFVLNAKWFHREGQLLAVDGDTWVGLAAVSLKPENQTAYNEHTGVLRAYRGRKMAQSLKVLAARYARQHGARQIGTDVDTLNPSMLAINQKMGYQPQAGRYLLVRLLNHKE